jgi:hypothetical protein
VHTTNLRYFSFIHNARIIMYEIFDAGVDDIYLEFQLVMNSTCIHLRVRDPNIYVYRRGRIYKEPPGEIQ